MTPLHERIRTDIESRILSGAAGPGDKLPSELELMELYDCSRMTVNKALSALNTAGLVERRKRAGTIVAHRRTESMVLDVPDLPVEIARRGQTYAYRLVEKLIRAPVRGDHDEVMLAGGRDLLLVKGVHVADDLPFAYEERLISLAAVPDIAACDFSVEPPGSWLLRNIPWTEAETRIGATAASADWAGVLGIAMGAACLTVERRTWRGQERITSVKQQFVAGRYELIARFGASR
jgi:GntR family histidine utilization transcriptional repressor